MNGFINIYKNFKYFHVVVSRINDKIMIKAPQAHKNTVE